MPRIIIKPKDISALSLIAQRPSDSRALVNGLSETARPIGLALTGRALPATASRKAKHAIEAARYLYKWGGAKNELRIANAAGRSVLSTRFKWKKAAKKKVARKAAGRKRAA